MSADQLSGVTVQTADPFGLGKRPFLAVLLIFLAGVGLTFTPCVLPMLPIIANIVARQQSPNTRRSFLLSSSYGLGVAIAYGLLGALIAYLGASFGLLGWLQKPSILISFAIIFVLLGLYMLDVISIRLPLVISQKLNSISQAGNNNLGSISGSFIVGLLSALVVSPCVSAPLSGALLAVSSIGNPILGFIALFALGCGLSLPLVIFATTEGKLLPKAGEWMNTVKKGFAYLMFAVALMMIERVVIHPIILVVWAGWFILMAWWLWRLSTNITSVIKRLCQLLMLASLLWAGVLLFGAYKGNNNSLQPLANINAPHSVNDTVLNHNNQLNTSTNRQSSVHPEIKVTTLAELDELLARQPKVVVDIMADWCIECKIMETELFTSPPPQLTLVPQQLNQSTTPWQLVKLDITTTDEQSKAVLQRYEIVGPPTLLYYRKGQLLSKQIGQTNRSDFVAVLQMLDGIQEQKIDN